MNKSILLTFFVAVFIFAGCSKEKLETPDKNEEHYPVTFTVNAFTHEITPMSGKSKSAIQANASTKSDLKSVINSLKYIIFDQNGNKLNERETDASKAAFGTINESLPVGNYVLYVAGFSGSYAGLYASDFSNVYVHLGEANNSDTFFKKIEFEVSGDPINQELEVERIVGRLDLVILDEIPVTVSEIVFSVNNVSSTYYTNDYGWYDAVVTSTTNKYLDSETSQYVWDNGINLKAYFFLAKDLDVEGTVHIRAYHENGSLAASKIVENVPLGIRKKTTLRGNLFDGTSDSDQSFMITAKADWRTDNSVIDF